MFDFGSKNTKCFDYWKSCYLCGLYINQKRQTHENIQIIDSGTGIGFCRIPDLMPKRPRPDGSVFTQKENPKNFYFRSVHG
jgi:hypothetical protein